MQLFHRDWVCLVDDKELARRREEVVARTGCSTALVGEPLWRQVTLKAYVEGPVFQLANVDEFAMRTGCHDGSCDRELRLLWAQCGREGALKLLAFIEAEPYPVGAKLLCMHADLVAGRAVLMQVLNMQPGTALHAEASAAAGF